MSSPRVRRLSMALVLGGTLAIGASTGAGAATPGTWGPPSALPTGTTSVGDQILSSPSGALLRYAVQDRRPTLTPLGPDGPGTATPIPSAPQDAVPGPVAFLPDGSAIVSYHRFASGPLQLVVRSADGTFGPVYDAGSHAQSFGVRGNEVVLLSQVFDHVDELTASSLAIGPGGALTPSGTSSVVYAAPGAASDPYGTEIGVPAIAIDADGQAEVTFTVDHISASGVEVLDAHRAADGSWSPPRSLSAGLPGASFASHLQVAVAPGGRALLAFQTGDGTLRKATLWRSVREPGGSFPAPTQVNDIAGAGGALDSTITAAGGDGTLALAVYALTCQAEDPSETTHDTLDVLVAAPGQGLADHPVGVLDTATAHSSLRSLGAGGGQAIVGLNDQQLTAGNPDNVCSTADLSGDAGTVSDRAAIVGGGTVGSGTSEIDHTFGSGQFAQTGNGSVQLAVDAGGLDPSGNAAVTGRLVTSGVPATAYFTGLGGTGDGGTGSGGTGGGTGSGGGGTGDGGSGGAGTTPTGDGSTAPGPTPLAPPAAAPVGATPPGPTTPRSPVPSSSTTRLSSAGRLSLTLTAPRLSPSSATLSETIALQVYTGAVPSTRAKRSASHLLGAVRRTVRLRSGQRLVVRLGLTPKLERYVRAHRGAGIRLQITSTQAAHGRTTTTRTVRRAG